MLGCERSVEAFRQPPHHLDAALGELVDLVSDLAQRVHAHRNGPYPFRIPVVIVEVRAGTGGQDHAGIQQAARVCQLLQPAHDGQRLAAPLRLDERRHVAASAVLRLERATVPIDHQRDQVVDEPLVARDRGRVVERLRDHEVEVAVLRVPEEDRFVVPVLPEERGQVVGGVRELVEGKGDVLDDHRGPALAHRSHRGKEALADQPELRLLRRVAGEARGLQQGQRGARFLRAALQLVRVAVAPRLELGQQRRRTRPQAFEGGRHARAVLDRAQRGAVHQLQRLGPRVAQRRDRRARGVHVWEQQQPRQLHGQVGDGREHRLRDERERPFAADEQVGEDVGGPREVEEGVE